LLNKIVKKNVLTPNFATVYCMFWPNKFNQTCAGHQVGLHLNVECNLAITLTIHNI